MIEGRTPHPRGGYYFEDFAIGATFSHKLRRTVTQMDIMSRPDAGLLEFRHRAFKQEGTQVAECRRTVFMRKRPPVTIAV